MSSETEVSRLLDDLAAKAVKVDVVTVEVDGVEMDEFRFVIDRDDLVPDDEG